MLLFQAPVADQALNPGSGANRYSSLAPTAHGLLLALPTMVCIVITLTSLLLASGVWFMLYMLEGEPITWECQGHIFIWLTIYLQGAVFGSFLLPQLLLRLGIPVGWKYL